MLSEGVKGLMKTHFFHIVNWLPIEVRVITAPGGLIRKASIYFGYPITSEMYENSIDGNVCHANLRRRMEVTFPYTPPGVA